MKQEMEEKGSSMSDGGEVNLVTVLGFDSGPAAVLTFPLLLLLLLLQLRW